MKKFSTIAIFLFFTLLLAIGIFTHFENRSRTLQIQSAVTKIQLSKIYVSLASFIKEYDKLPEDLDDLYKKTT